MTAPTHHPAPEMVLAYSNGGLGEAEALIVAVHLALCPECRKAASLCDCIGGRMLEDAPATTVSTSCRDKIFAAIGCDRQESVLPSIPIPADCFIPEPLRGYLNGASCRSSVRQLIWNPVQPGVAEYELPITQGCHLRGARAKFMHLKPGAEFIGTPDAPPPMMLVLCGLLTTTATVYQAGDFAVIRTARAGDADCFCLLVTAPSGCPVSSKLVHWLKALWRSR